MCDGVYVEFGCKSWLRLGLDGRVWLVWAYMKVEEKREEARGLGSCLVGLACSVYYSSDHS